MGEQRKFRRAPLDVYMNKYVSGVPYLARGNDISPDGMRLERLLEPEAGQRRVGLQFQLPGSDEVIYAEGELVEGYAKLQQAAADASPNDDASYNGVRFTLLTERHRRMINDYVQRSSSEN